MKILFGEGETKSEYLNLNEAVKDKVAISFILLLLPFWLIIHMAIYAGWFL